MVGVDPQASKAAANGKPTGVKRKKKPTGGVPRRDPKVVKNNDIKDLKVNDDAAAEEPIAAPVVIAEPESVDVAAAEESEESSKENSQDELTNESPQEENPEIPEQEHEVAVESEKECVTPTDSPNEGGDTKKGEEVPSATAEKEEERPEITRHEPVEVHHPKDDGGKGKQGTSSDHGTEQLAAAEEQAGPPLIAQEDVDAVEKVEITEGNDNPQDPTQPSDARSESIVSDKPTEDDSQSAEQTAPETARQSMEELHIPNNTDSAPSSAKKRHPKSPRGNPSPRSPRNRASRAGGSPRHPKLEGSATSRSSPLAKKKSKRIKKDLPAPPVIPNGPFDKISVYRNGDKNFPGADISLDSRIATTWDHFLDHVTKAIGVTQAVRRMYNIESGKEVTNLDGLEDGKSYVATVGSHAYKRLNYLKIVDYKTREQNYVSPDLSSLKYKPKVDVTRFSNLQSGHAMLSIYVLPNGDDSGVGRKFLFKQKTVTMEKILSEITDRFQTRLIHGSAEKLFTLDGKEISTLEQVKEGGVYVAFDKGPLKLPPFKVNPDGSLTRKPQQKVPFKLKPIIQRPKLPKKSNNGPPSPSSKKKIRSPKKNHKPSSAKTSAELQVPHKQKRTVSAPDYQQEAPLTPQAPLPKITSREDALRIMDELYEQLTQNLSPEDVDSSLSEIQRHLRDTQLHHRSEAPQVTTAFDDRVDDVLNFMMKPNDGDHPLKSPEDIRRQFETVVQAALGGRLAHWETTPTSFVALVILLDQFPRSIYRDTPQMYSGDGAARDVVLRAVFQSGIMDEVHPVYRLFPCLALTHQEDMDMQKLCISEWARAANYFDPDDPILDYNKSFKDNFEVIERFGRFPDRNAMMNRQSTKDERVYLGDDYPGQVPRAKVGRKSSMVSRIGNHLGSKLRASFKPGQQQKAVPTS